MKKVLPPTNQPFAGDAAPTRAWYDALRDLKFIEEETISSVANGTIAVPANAAKVLTINVNGEEFCLLAFKRS